MQCYQCIIINSNPDFVLIDSGFLNLQSTSDMTFINKVLNTETKQPVGQYNISFNYMKYSIGQIFALEVRGATPYQS